MLDDLLAEPALVAVADFDGSQPGAGRRQARRELLIGRFSSAAVPPPPATAYGDGPLRRYDADLIVPATVRAECALLKGIALRYVMRRAGSEQRYAREQEVLQALVSALVVRGAGSLDPVFAPLWRAAARRRRPAAGGHRPGGLAHRRQRHRVVLDHALVERVLRMSNSWT